MNSALLQRQGCRSNRCDMKEEDDLALVWNVTSLKPIPRYHPIDRNSLKIVDLKMGCVSSRISKFLKIHSIQASYETTKVGLVSCLDENLIQFTIQLWLGQPPKTILVEVGRIRGCAIGFHKIRNSLYNAILKGKQESKFEKHYVTSDHMNNTSNSRCQSNHRERTAATTTTATARETTTPQVEVKQCNSKQLETCFDLLHRRYLHHNIMGMKYLLFLTDPSKGAKYGMDFMSPLSCDHPIFQMIINYLKSDTTQSKNYDPEFEKDNEDSLISVFDKNCYYFQEIRLLTLRVLWNLLKSSIWQKDALTATTTHDDSNHSSQSSLFGLDLSSSFWQTVLPILLHNLATVWIQPFEATVSLECIRLLQILQPCTILVANDLMHNQLLEILEGAHQYGRTFNLRMQKDSMELITLAKPVLYHGADTRIEAV